jgi:hypothetical protein
MNWNHRVIEVDNGGEKLFEFAEVFYADDKPISFTEPFMSSETIDGLRELIKRLEGALEQKVLTQDDLTN